MSGRWLILLAAVLWSTSGFFAKSPVFAGLEDSAKATLLAFWRSLFAALLVIFLVRSWRWDWRLLAMGGSFAAMTWTFMSSLVFVEASLAIWLQYLAPAWVVVLSWCLFREAPDRPSRWMLMFAMLGVGIILVGQFPAIGDTEKFSWWGIIAGLLSGVFFAGVIVMLRRLRDFDAMQLVLINQIFTSLMLLPATISVGIWPGGIEWVYLVTFGFVQLGTPYILFAYGVRTVSSHEASGLGLLEPLLVPLWVFLAWRHLPNYQAPSLWTLTGGILILIGLGLQIYLRRKRLPPGLGIPASRVP